MLFPASESASPTPLRIAGCSPARILYLHLSINFCNCLNCCCCSAYFSSCHRTASDANLLDDPHTFHYNDYFVIGGIRTCLEVSNDRMFLWISSNSCPLNLLLVRSHHAEIIIVKRLIEGRNNVTRVRVEPRPFDQGRRKNDAFTHWPRCRPSVLQNFNPTDLQNSITRMDLSP